MLKIYDTRLPIHSSDKNDSLDKLDEMLTQYGVDHYFAIPTSHEIDEAEANGKPIDCFLFYRSEQNVELTLIVSLYTRLFRDTDKQRILEGIVKSLSDK